MEIIILLIINFVLLGVLYFDISWSNGLRRKLDIEKAKNADLRNRLDEKAKENVMLSARLEARECHRIMLRDDQIVTLKRRADKLNKMVVQKWREAKNVDIQD